MTNLWDRLFTVADCCIFKKPSHCQMTSSFSGLHFGKSFSCFWSTRTLHLHETKACSDITGQHNLHFNKNLLNSKEINLAACEQVAIEIPPSKPVFSDILWFVFVFIILILR